MTDKIEAKVTHHFAAAPERVYDALTDPGRIRLWQQAWLAQSGLDPATLRCEVDAREGGRFFYSDLRDGREARHWGTFLTLYRPTRIVHTWITDAREEDDPSIVTIVIEPAPEGHEGSAVTLYHEMDARWAEHRAATERGWQLMLLAVEGLLLAEGDLTAPPARSI